MSKVMRRVVVASVIIGGLTAVTAGEVSAHFPSITPGAICVEGGGWQATVTIQFSEPGGTSGTVTSTYPAGSSTTWQLPASTPRTFGAGVVIPVTVDDVTFTVTGSWDDGTQINQAVTIQQPPGCTSETTTTSTTTTTTTAASTTTAPAGSTTTTAPGGTTTSSASPATTTLPPGTVTAGGSSAGGSVSSSATLPATGPTTLPTALLALSALGAGIVLVRLARRPASRS